jgi:hypothetical protein
MTWHGRHAPRGGNRNQWPSHSLRLDANRKRYRSHMGGSDACDTSDTTFG